MYRAYPTTTDAVMHIEYGIPAHVLIPLLLDHYKAAMKALLTINVKGLYEWKHAADELMYIHSMACATACRRCLNRLLFVCLCGSRIIVVTILGTRIAGMHFQPIR